MNKEQDPNFIVGTANAAQSMTANLQHDETNIQARLVNSVSLQAQQLNSFANNLKAANLTQAQGTEAALAGANNKILMLQRNEANLEAQGARLATAVLSQPNSFASKLVQSTHLAQTQGTKFAVGAANVINSNLLSDQEIMKAQLANTVSSQILRRSSVAGLQRQSRSFLDELTSPKRFRFGTSTLPRQDETEMVLSGQFVPSSSTDLGDNDDGDNHAGPRHSTKLRSGTFKLATPERAHVANQCPYVYIPQALLSNPNFDFDDVFKALGLVTPAMIFRLTSAHDPSKWNVRLPASRHDLIEVYKQLEEKNGNQEFAIDEDLNPYHDDHDVHANLVEGNREDNNEPEEQKQDILLLPPSPMKDANNQSDKPNDIRDKVKDKDKEKNKFRDPHGKIQHYQGVLRENCKRLLMGTYTACEQAGAIFRIDATWSDEYRQDIVADWISDADNAILLGIADTSEFEDNVWNDLDKGAKTWVENPEQRTGKSSTSDVIIDPTSFHNRPPRELHSTEHIPSIPHRRLTHLIVSDNRQLLDKRLQEVVPWGLIMVNGDKHASEIMVNAVQHGRPLICVKYTGGAADQACEMLESVEYFIEAKKTMSNIVPDKPFREDMLAPYRHQHWLKSFDEDAIEGCGIMNVLIENWPDRFNPLSVFVVDMFSTTEDEVQDRITLTMGVVFEAAHELGGNISEQRRLTYAWRMRQRLQYNATIFKLQSDVLMMLVIMFTMFSTLSAVLYTYIDISPINFGKHTNFAMWILLKANLLLPLVATVIRGIYGSISPMLKYIALKNATVQVESEIYMYRTKIGKYSGRKVQRQEQKNEDNKKESKDEKTKIKDTSTDRMNPSRYFSSALDGIWLELASSDVQKGSLKTPFESNPVNDVNRIIRTNRKEQNAYFTPLLKLISDKDANKIVKDDADVEAANVKRLEAHGKKPMTFVQRLNLYSIRFTEWKKNTAIAIPFFTPIPKDDGLSPLSADDYLKIRLVPMAAYYSRSTPYLASTILAASIVVVILSVAASALSTFGLSVFIPAALALSGAITSWMNYQQTELRLLQTNSAFHHLNQLLVWWDGLTMIEKRVPSHKEMLVKTTENCIQAQATIFSGGQTSRRSNSDDNDDNDENKT